MAALAGMAQAQVPGGPYLQSCRDVRASGGTVSAVCRRSDGSWVQSQLQSADRCAGGVGNTNGQLGCAAGNPSSGGGQTHAYELWDDGSKATQSSGGAKPPAFGSYNGFYGFGR
ncbi:MAG TPA: hypothetical protein VHW90_04875 [Stellaceae bacterium]|nr:hypothetical protein [Stellaceae bacterium]